MRKTGLLLTSMVLAMLLACTAAVLAPVHGAAQTTRVTLVGAGT
jgi:hypothetical protein